MENPILVEVNRGGLLESFHRGAVCVVNSVGEIVFELGNSMQMCYPRSAMKFVQVLPLVELGGIEKFQFTDAEIAVMCGSHNAESFHLDAVRSILQKIDLREQELGCGAQYPSSKRDANALVQAGTKPTAIHNNCSGKHAGMLALCKLLAVETHNYLDPHHPVQQLILTYVAEMYEWPASKMICALDGCTAPIYSIPVYHQALCFKNLVHPIQFSDKRQEACRIVLNAISKHPEMVAGTHRYCTDMMKESAPQIIGKTGAEGIFCMSFLEHKYGVCIKIDDGKMLPQYNVAQAILEASGLLTKEQEVKLHPYCSSELKNFNQLVTGQIRAKTELFAPIKLLF